MTPNFRREEKGSYEIGYWSILGGCEFLEPKSLDICMVEFKQMEDFSAVHEVQNNFGRFETCGFDAKETNNVNPMVTAQLDNLEIDVFDVKQVEDTNLIDQLGEQFEVDTGSKIYPSPEETVFEY